MDRDKGWHAANLVPFIRGHNALYALQQSAQLGRAALRRQSGRHRRKDAGSLGWAEAMEGTEAQVKAPRQQPKGHS